MKTGDIVTDSRARAWTLGSVLGEGIWGRSWVVRDDDGRQRVLKVPYEPDELPPASADRAALMRACAEEQARLLQAGAPHLIALEDRITLPTGAVSLLMPMMPTTLHRQLHSGLPLTEALHELLAVVDLLEKARAAHGNLRPSNILIDPHGAPVLTDVATPSSTALLAAAERSTPSRRRWAPPDQVAADTWAICQALYAAVFLEDGDGDGTALPAAPMEGLDKVARAALKDHAIARLKRDGANSRFVGRASERLVALLARGLSQEVDPSPPYRFLRAADLRPRLAEIVALVHPTVESVGKLLLSNHASGEVFRGPGPVGFTVSVALSEGLTDPEDLVCGVRLTDLDASGDGRVPLENAQFAVNRHPSGRLRFEFNLPEVAPGRYAVRVAFSVKDSGDEPVVAEGQFEVRPEPGWVPPKRAIDGPVPLAFNRPAAAMSTGFDDDDEDDDDSPTVRLPRSFDLDSDPGGELIDAFPRPLAPTSPGAPFLRSAEDDATRPPPSDTPPRLDAPRPAISALATPPPSDAGDDPSSVGIDLDPPIAFTSHAPRAVAPTPGPGPVREPPSVVQARPSITVAQPAAAPPAQPVPAVTAPPRPAPAPLPAPAAHDDPWQTSQVEEADFFGGGALPGGDDLLPESPKPPSAVNAALTRLQELIQRDSPTAIGVAVAGCFLLLVVAMVIARSC